MRVMYTLETITLQPFDVVHSVFFLFFFFFFLLGLFVVVFSYLSNHTVSTKRCNNTKIDYSCSL